MNSSSDSSRRSDRSSRSFKRQSMRAALARRAAVMEAALRSRPSFVVFEPLEGRRLLSSLYTVANLNDHGNGSLRTAITSANANAGSTIQFAAGLTGPISLQTPLPPISASMTITGTVDSTGTPLIDVDGTHLTDTVGGTVGLEIDAVGVTVSGLAIDNFTTAEIHLGAGGDDTIQGNYLGLNSQNETLYGTDAGDGIVIDSAGNLVGGSSAADRNVISGNPVDGVEVNGNSNEIEGNYIGTDSTGSTILYNNNNGITVKGAANTTIVGNLISGNNNYGIDIESVTNGTNIIAGNYVGTDATGMFTLPNQADGIYLDDSSGITIGGSAAPSTNLAGGGVSANAGNLISGNYGNGITFGITLLGSSSNSVEGNFIGTDITATEAPQGNYGEGNGGDGVEIDGSYNTVGLPGAANVIDFNGGDGVDVDSGAYNSVRGNSIYANFDLGIDLGMPYSPISNDSLGHSGPNFYQDFPVITSIANNNGTLTISGTLANGAVGDVVDFYSNATGDPSGYGQGQVYLGSAPVAADGTFTGSFPLNASGQTVVAATATDSLGNTSEFSLTCAIPTGIVHNTPVATQLALRSSDPVSVFGQLVTFTATVSPLSGSNVPGGSVVFMDGSTVLGTGTLTDGVATFSVSDFDVASHNITAQYSPNTNNSGSTGSLTQIVNQNSTATTIVSSSTATDYGQSVTFTATVAINDAGSGTPTGLVTFYDGNTVLGTPVALNSSGVAALTLSSLPAGGDVITAVYGGDANDLGSSNFLTQNVDENSTTTTIVSSSTTTDFGQSVTFTATVAVSDAGSGTPSGSVTFMDGSTVLDTVALDSNGVATLSISNLSVAGHTITAIYGGDANDLGSSNFLTQTVNPNTTSTVVTSSNASSYFGQSITFTATVSLTSAGMGMPGGTVTFEDGDTVLGTGTLDANGVATFTTTSSLATGSHTINAVYGGDANDVGSTGTMTQVVNQNTTSTVVSSSNASSLYGQSITFTATVSLTSAGMGMPGGTVTFEDGDTVLGTGTLDANGVATFTTASSLATGSHTINAVYGGDANDAGSTGTMTQVVNQNTTSTVVVSSSTTTDFGQSVTFTATVTVNDAGSGTPSGSVTFMDGSTVLGTGTLDSNGVAMLSVSNLSVADHTITAIYGGDANDTGSNASLSQEVDKDNTATALVASAGSATYGQAITFTATVSLAGLGAGTPTGLVSFMDGATLLGTASVAADGTAVLITSSMLVGDHSITAVYSGDTDCAGSASAPLSETVNAIQTNTTLNSSADPAVYGQNVTLTATVTALSGSAIPTGSVLFMDGTTILGTATVDGNGLATLSLSNLSVGPHAITATYSGDANDATSAAALTQTIQESQTATTLTSSTSSATYGDLITFTATVAVNDSGSGTPSGSVSFMDGSTVLGTVPVDTNGVATLSVSDLAVGSHSITASYSGDTNFTPSVSGPVSESVNLIQTATTLISSFSSSVYGQGVTFTATVISASGSVPTGSVVFMDGSTILGSVDLDANGIATLSLSTLNVGSHAITVTYGGSATDAGSTASLTQTVGLDNTSTTLSSTADPSVYGQAITFTATVSGIGLRSGDVVFMDNTTDTVLGTVAVTNGVASLTLSNLAVGAHNITASYTGDATDCPSSASLSQNINRDRTTTTLVLSAATTDYGQSVIFTATVNIADLGSGTPTGTVTFYDGSTVVGTAPLGSNGSASITCSTLAVGSDAITAQYSGDGNFAGSISNTVIEAVDLLSTSTSLTSSTDPSDYGQGVLFTATVSGGLDETGSILFSDASTGAVLGTVAINANGTATLSVSSLAVGAHAITATYSGDADNAGSSASLNQSVDLNSTATSLTSSAASVTYGQSVTFTATVSLASAGIDTPTGNVVFMDGSTVIGTVPINANGVATLSISSLAVGGHAITATYGGDANDSGSSASLVQKVTVRSTTTTLASSLSPSIYGQSVTFTATVTYGSGVPSGSVTFMDGSTTLGSAPIHGSGVATFTDAKLAAGSHTITASYGGDTNDAASSASLTQCVSKDNTATTLNSSANPSVYGQSVTFTATLTNLTLGTAQAGSITFMDGSTTLGTLTVNGSGVATLTTSSMAVGSNAITASFAGDANDVASSASLTQSVNKVCTTTTLASTANPSVYGQAITLTAAVTGNSPTGSVVFMDGSTVLGTISLSGSKASLTLSGLAVGANSITATYSGDTNNASSSASLTQTVNKNTTSTVVASSNACSYFGQSVTFTATVTLTGAGSGTPTGVVTFSDGSTVLGTGTLSAGGVATFTTSSLAVASQTITATYAGDTNDVGSSGTMTQVVKKNTTSTVVVSSCSTSTSGQSVTFTATVALTSAGSDTPTGTVTFYNGSTVLGTGTLNSSGVATLSVSTLAVGSYTITATYAGDANDVGSSGSTCQVVNAAVGSISGYTLNDLTGNGLSSDDTPLSGVKVEIFLDKDGNSTLDSGDGNAIATLTTGSNGAYSFTNLAKGTYFVEEVTPSGYVLTAPALGTYYTNAINANNITNEDFDNYNTTVNNSAGITNITYTDGCHTYTSLRDAPVNQGDTVTVTFTILKGYTETLSFVSYTAPGSSFDATDAYEQVEYNHVTETFTTPGTYKMTIKVPPSYFQVDFVMGQYINTFGPANSNIFYSAQDRLIDANNGGITPPNNVLPLN